MYPFEYRIFMQNFEQAVRKIVGERKEMLQALSFLW